MNVWFQVKYPGNYRQIIQPLLANKIKTNPFTGQILALVLWLSQEPERSGMRPAVAYFLSCPSGAFYKGPALPLRILNACSLASVSKVLLLFRFLVVLL